MFSLRSVQKMRVLANLVCNNDTVMVSCAKRNKSFTIIGLPFQNTDVVTQDLSSGHFIDVYNEGHLGEYQAYALNVARSIVDKCGCKMVEKELTFSVDPGVTKFHCSSINKVLDYSQAMDDFKYGRVSFMPLIHSDLQFMYYPINGGISLNSNLVILEKVVVCDHKSCFL